MTTNLDTTHPPHLLVSAGILFNEKGEFLLASRPQGKAYAGYWEFPGGKIEQGETALAALIRELQEEMGITVTQSYPWLQQNFTYPHAHVTLFFFQITAWQGDIMAKEQQQFTWQTVHHLTAQPILPANGPILRALALPRVLPMSNVTDLGEVVFLQRLRQQLDKGLSSFILYEPQLNNERFIPLAEKVMALTEPYMTKVIVHRHFSIAKELGAAGVHLTSADLINCTTRPNIDYCGASIHHPRELIRAAELKLDYVLVGPIHTSATHFPMSSIDWQQFGQILQHQNTMPVYAFGDVNHSDIQQARSQGAHGIALRQSAWQ